MEELRALEARLEQALTVLEQSEGAGAGGDNASAGRIAELEAENRALGERLDKMSAEREKDLKQLDTLIAQLRPLIEESV